MASEWLNCMVYLPRQVSRTAPGKGKPEHGRKHAGDTGDLAEPDRLAKDEKASMTAETGASAVKSAASVPLTLSAPAYHSRNPPTVGTSA